MGFLHVVKSGKGMYLRTINKDIIKGNITLPKKEILIEILKEDNKNVTFLNDLSELEILEYLAMDEYDYKDFLKKYEILNADNFRDFTLNYLDEYYCNELLTKSLAILFCLEYDYPLNSFTSVKDYNEEDMIYCSYSYPPKNYNEKMSKLTEDTLEKQLQEFMYKITKDEWYLNRKIELCEEYQKD